MRSLIVASAWLFAASLCGCGEVTKGAPPSITITPSDTSGPVQVTGPTAFTAELVNVTGEVTWMVSGGTVSPTTGLHVTYTPAPGSTTEQLNAAVGSLQASVKVASSPAPLTSKTIPGLTAPVSVQYDAQDIPHIQCAQAADCVAVQGYLQARDRWFPMDFLRHVARGHLAELIGLDGLSSDVQLRTLFTTRDGKRIEGELTKGLDNDPTTKALVTAFVTGINAYINELKMTPDLRLGGEYAQLPFPLTAGDIDPWTPQDTLAIARLNQFQLSESLNNETANGQFAAVYGAKDPSKIPVWIRAAAPTSEQGHTLSVAGTHAAAAAAKVPACIRGRMPNLTKWAGPLRAAAKRMAVLHDQLRPADATVGSNNWVVSAAKSTSGVAMVANDPHLSLQYPPLFHLATLTSSNAADNLDLTGGSFPGIPGALVGRGKHVGWGVTVVGYDVTDVYLEQFLPQGNCPTPVPCVLFKGAPVATILAPQTYKVRVGPGAAGLVDSTTLHLPPSSAPPPVVLIVPHHGPIISAPDATGKGVSVRWTGHETNTQDIKAFYGLNTATSVDDAILALKNYATGAQNFVLADDAGHIAYDPHALVPVRDFADASKTAPDKLIPPWFPLPGDGSAEWGPGGTGCSAAAGVPATCWIADEQLPQGKDPAKGYFFTANADPTSLGSDPEHGVSDDNNPLAHPPYLSYDWDDSSGFRATRIEQMLEAAIAAHGSVSADDMAAIQTDHVSRPGMALTPIIAAIPTANAPAEFAVAKGILALWASNGWDCPSGVNGTDPKTSPAVTDPTVIENSSGCFLFHVFLRALVTNVFADDLKVAGQGVNGLAALKALLFMLDSANAGNPANTSFCNDVDATGALVKAHSCGEQVVTALVQAYDTLAAQVGADPSTWTWGRVHTIRPVSLLALVTTNYSPGPFARPGGAFTVDVGSPSLSGSGLDFAYGSGGNVRHISLMDPSKPKTRMQLPGPERDGPTTFAGPGLLSQWVKNTYFDYAIGDQITPVAVATQTFKAQ